MEIKLKQGKLYDCSVDSKGIIEISSIIPLAEDNKSKRQFVMVDARKLYKQNPNYVKEIIKMSFDEIMNDGIQSRYPHEYEALSIPCTPQKDGTLLDYDGSSIFGFIETDII